MRQSQAETENALDTRTAASSGLQEAARIPDSSLSALVGTGRPNAAAHTRAFTQLSRSHPSRATQTLLHMQRVHGNQYVQRVIALSRQSQDEGEVHADVEASIERSRGGGQGMESATKSQMESSFGADFSSVRIHTGTESHALNRAVSAVAFTTGNDIFFRDGAYNPGSTEGKELLAHELTHVVQQGDAPGLAGQSQSPPISRMCSHCQEEHDKGIHPKLMVGAPDSIYEKEAEDVARHVVSRKAVSANSLDRSKAELSRTLDSAEQEKPGLLPDLSPGTDLEFVTDHPFQEASPARASSPTTSGGFDVVRVKEAVMTHNGISRRVSLHNQPDAWIARKMNWKDSACKAACWAAGGALAVLIASACAVGSVFTLGGLAIPCTVALGIVGAAVGGAGASICSDLCDNALASNAGGSAQATDGSTPDTAVATADGSPVPAPDEAAA